MRICLKWAEDVPDRMASLSAVWDSAVAKCRFGTRREEGVPGMPTGYGNGM